MKQFTFLLVICSINYLIPCMGKSERIWEEQDGCVIIEIESVDSVIDTEKWELLEEPAGYTGTGYLVWKKWGNMYKDSLVYDALDETGDVLTYTVWINNPGEYAIHIRNIHQQEDGDNDVWGRVDRSDYFKIWDHHTGEFTWTEFDWQTWQLQEGPHEIALGGRSKGFGIDRIALHKVDLPESIWGNPQKPESPLVSPPLSLDTMPPYPPKNLRILKTSMSSIQLTWFPAQDNQRIHEYEVYANNRLAGTTSVNSYILSGLQEGTLYSIYVQSKDTAGNRSLKSEPVEVTTQLFAESEGIFVKYIREAPIIDGEFDSVWHRQIPFPLQHLVSGTRESEKDLHGCFRMAWDDENLYVLVEVHDDVSFPELKEDVNSSDTDGVKLYFDPDHSQSPTFGIDDRRYRYIGNNDCLRESIQRDVYVEGVQAALGGSPPGKRSWHEKPDGYFLEMAFPWQTLGVEPSEGKRFGVDVIIQDNDGRTGIEGQIAWNGVDENTGSSPYHLGSAKLVRGVKSGNEEEFLPFQVWKEKDGVVVVEAEEIQHDPNWQYTTEPAGYSGDAYLLWQGPNRSVTHDGRGGNDDYTNERQGPQDEWLIVRVLISHPGFYRVNARNYHVKEDGDNDAWVWIVGQEISDWNPVRRMGDSLNDGKGFTWLDWGERKFWLKAGVNNIYIGGRSIGFGIDRIAIYRENTNGAKEKALDLSTLPSQLAERTW